MGKVGRDKPRTSKRKCRRKKRKQRTSGKKGQCDRVNAPKAKERVHDVAKNINEDVFVPRVPGFAVVEVPTRVNATEGKVHLKNNSCDFEFDLPSSSSVGRKRSNFLCGVNKAWEGPFRSCTAFLIGFVPPDTFLATARVIRPVLIGFWLCASVSPPVRHLCFGQCESSCLAPMLRLG
ncbi:hypothetical protein GQ457_12G029260 [Hibiscus cannabinus]